MTFDDLADMEVDMLTAGYIHFCDRHGYANGKVVLFGSPEVIMFYSDMVNGDVECARTEMFCTLDECMSGGL